MAHLTPLRYRLSSKMANKKRSGDVFEPKAFYSPSELAAILGVSVSYVNSQVEKGAIRAIRLSPRVTRIPYAAVMRLVGSPLEVTVERRSAAERARERAVRRDEDVPVPRRRIVG